MTRRIKRQVRHQCPRPPTHQLIQLTRQPRASVFVHPACEMTGASVRGRPDRPCRVGHGGGDGAAQPQVELVQCALGRAPAVLRERIGINYGQFFRAVLRERRRHPLPQLGQAVRVRCLRHSPRVGFPGESACESDLLHVVTTDDANLGQGAAGSMQGAILMNPARVLCRPTPLALPSNARAHRAAVLRCAAQRAPARPQRGVACTPIRLRGVRCECSAA
jgi:hypothetical protein